MREKSESKMDACVHSAAVVDERFVVEVIVLL